jgi:hypothetical protein
MNFKCAALAMALFVGPIFAPVQAQDFPNFDIPKACDAQVKEAVQRPTSVKSCMAEELTSREFMLTQWHLLNAGTRTRALQDLVDAHASGYTALLRAIDRVQERMLRPDR